ncbi:MAG: type II toxin-antitoxin system VapC family toxin [Deltaproteobacteria bacterium]|nr:type II toxin-antitoxin system VapC family toxin [Deltaproteobacteria bacterium]
MVVLDTCCLIELCKIRPSVSDSVRQRIEKGAVVLSVSFAEIALKLKKKRLDINLTGEELYRSYREIPEIQIVDIGCPEWFDAINLNWRHQDPADRLIVGYAKRMNFPIVTTDRGIKKFHVEVLW